jgi:hypothetical protein
MIASYSTALLALAPTSSWNIQDPFDYSTITWLSPDIAQPTQQACDEEILKQGLDAPYQACKQQASGLLYATDWTTIPDVSDSAVSNPYLLNASEFAAYRSQVRQLAVNPVVDPVFPTVPTAQWSS